MLPIVLGVVGVVAALIVVLCVVVALQPTAFRISRSATMGVTPEAAFALVNDFHKWEGWSPWAKLDPNAKNGFEGAGSGKGAVFTWSGNNKVGQGRMEILESRPGEVVRIKLDFLRPMRASNVTEFTFRPDGGGGGRTVVNWAMTGRNGFMGKAFGLMMNMDKCVGKDFEKGLAAMEAAGRG